MRFVSTRSAIIAAALVGALAAGVTPSFAGSPSAADRATARTLMTEGYTALKNGEAAKALEKFRAADALVHVPTTGLAVAEAQVQLGQLVEAEQSATAVVNMPAHDDDPAPFRKAREDAAALLRDVDPRVPALKVHLRGLPADVVPRVTVDDEAVPAAALAAPRRMNPGRHAVVVSVGDWVHRVDVILKDRDQQDVTFDVPEGVHAAPSESAAPPLPGSTTTGTAAPPGSSAPASSTTTSVTPPEEGPSAGRVVMWGGFVVGAIGVAVGATAGILAVSDKNKAFGMGCQGNVCPTSAHDALQGARTSADVATVGFIVGGAGAAVGIVALLLSGPSKTAASSTGLQLTPIIGPGRLGVEGRF